MRRPASTWRIFVVCLLVATTGCAPTQPFYLHEDGDLSHYIDKATQAETPDLNCPPLADVAQADEPLTLSRPDFKGFWDLTLEECVAIALANSKVLRTSGGSLRIQGGSLVANTAVDSLVEGAQGSATTYNPAIVESNPGQGIGSIANFVQNPGAGGGFAVNGDGGIAGVREGVEAALAEFDAQLNITGSPLFQTQDRPRNIVQSVVTSVFPTIQRTQSGNLNVEIAKRTAEGTVFRFTSETDSLAGNVQGFPTNQPLFGIWTQILQMEVRQPLLQGRGAQVNRMPIVLARIGTDMEIAGLEEQLQDALNTIEFRYWDLYLQYRNVETARVARDSALGTWRIVYAKLAGGTEPVQAEAQAREQYFNFRSQLESALRQLYDAENELRFLMGLAATDGRLIRPKDEPTLAEVEFGWSEILAEAIARRPELIQQRWRIKQREMELILARNQLLPRLDVGAQYRWLGIGDRLITADRTGIPFKDVATDTGQGSSAWEELTGGKYQEFALQFQYQMPIGFRRELAGVRHQQLRLAREKAILEDMELDVSHGLAKGVRNLDTNFKLSQTGANRWAASQEDVEAREERYLQGASALDDVLEAQRRRALAQFAFWQAVVAYNQAIADLHTRKGSIMEYDGVGYEEGPWPQKAYWDALARARERDAGMYVDYGWTRPRVISRGRTPQTAEEAGVFHTQSADSGSFEELPAGQPTPAAPEKKPAEATPETKPVPQETRRQPMTTVRPAGFASPSMDNGNPLRGSARQPVGTGVSNDSP
jgi:outer membrane protein TolC